MSIFYLPQLQKGVSHYELSEEESKHCIKVLRMQTGAELELINGIGLQAHAVLKVAHVKKSIVEILALELHPPTQNIHIALAPTKNADRLEWFVEKATELGMTKLSFIRCERSERKQLNLARLEKIAIAAIKQSKRFYLPQIFALDSFDEFVQKYPNGYIGHCYDGPKIGLKSLDNNRPFLIGPEGDFTQKEIDLALIQHYEAVDMSSYRLRTETAALLATTALIR